MSTGTLPARHAAVFEGNLTVLAEVQPDLVPQLQAVDVAQQAVRATGRDGAPTFRLAAEPGGAKWLGHSSMPSISAPALLQDFDTGNANVMLVSIGHGYEARQLLRQLKPHQAVFTWDSDPLAPALALHLHDFSEAIAGGRLVLCIDSDPTAALLAALKAHPSHVPPEKMLSAPFLTAGRMAELHNAIEAAAITHANRLADDCRALQKLSASARTFRSGGVRRFAILSMVPDQTISAVARALQRTLQLESIECVVHVADSPARVHLRSVCKLLGQQNFTDVILLNQVRREFGNMLAGSRCVSWFVASHPIRSDLKEVVGDDDVLLAYSADTGRQLDSRLKPRRPAHVTGPGADAQQFKPLKTSAEQQAEFGSDVSIVLDAAALSPDALGLKWDSHKILLGEVIDHLQKEPERLDEIRAEALLSRMCRATDVRLDTSEIRRRLIQTMITHLAPTTAALSLARALRAAGLQVIAWGHNWDRLPESAPWARQIYPNAHQRNLIYNCSTIILHVSNDDHDEQHLLDALCAGAAVLRQKDSGASHTARRACQQVWALTPAFTDVQDCVDQSLKLCADPDLRSTIMKPAHDKVRTECLMHHRCHELLKLLD